MEDNSPTQMFVLEKKNSSLFDISTKNDKNKNEDISDVENSISCFFEEEGIFLGRPN